MPTTETVIPGEVTRTVYGAEGWLDLPLIVLALLLSMAAAAASRRKSYLLLAAALACFASKQAVFYLNVEPTPGLTETQRWIGTAGWLFLVAFAGVSIRRRAAVPRGSAG